MGQEWGSNGMGPHMSIIIISFIANSFYNEHSGVSMSMKSVIYLF